MSEYAIVLRVDNPEWQEGCPLQIVALQISRNKETASCYLQSRVINIGRVTISAIGLSATIVDANGASETIEIISLDNALEPGCSLSLPARHINATEPQSIDALISRVDEDANFGGPIQLPLSNELALTPKALSEREAQLIEVGVDPSACSRRHHDYGRWWLCGCGALNVLREECHSCGASRELLAHLEDDELLTNAADMRAVERARATLSSNDPSAMKSAAEMLPDDDNSKELRNELISKAAEIVSKQKRLSRLAIIAGLCTVVVIGGSVLATNVIGAATKRHQAEQLISEGNYREAMAIYTELDDGEKYEQTQSMQCETEYQYIQEHLINSDETTYQYLCELKDLGYRDAADIYSSLYQWHFELVATTKEAYEAKGLVNLTEYREPVPLSESACAVLKCWGGYPGEEKEAFVHFACEIAPFTTSTRHFVTGYKTLEGGLAADSDDAVHLFQLNLDTEYDAVPVINKPEVRVFEITQVPRDMTSITAEAYVDGFGRFDSSEYTNSGSAFASVLLNEGTIAPVATSGTITTTIQ